MAVNQIQYSTNLSQTNWLVLTNLVVTQSNYWFVDVSAPPGPKRFYRVEAFPTNIPPPAGMVLVPADSFTMGDTFAEWEADELPLHTVYVSAYYMDQYEVTKYLWDDVYTWAVSHGYNFQFGAAGKQSFHPAHSMTWYDAVKWCNARSEKEGRTPAYYVNAAQTQVYRDGQADVPNDWVKWNAGYRLPTEAEWEKAARGGAGGHRFPWSDVNTISHSRANYWAGNSGAAYDLSYPAGFHPAYAVGGQPYTSPVGSFAANEYGLYDMAGNVQEWCWDWGGPYSSSPVSDPRGAATGAYRAIRGGGWGTSAQPCRAADRFNAYVPTTKNIGVGFRCVL